jgi:hypothetical protein
MLIRITGGSTAALEDAGNMKALSILRDCGGEEFAAAIAEIGVAEGSAHVWVDIAWLSGQALAGAPERQAEFDGMIAYATKKGWVDEAARRVRVHVEDTT